MSVKKLQTIYIKGTRLRQNLSETIQIAFKKVVKEVKENKKLIQAKLISLPILLLLIYKTKQNKIIFYKKDIIRYI